MKLYSTFSLLNYNIYDQRQSLCDSTKIHESNGDNVGSQFSVDIKIFVIEIYCKFTQLHTILCGFLVLVLRTNLIPHLMNSLLLMLHHYGDQMSNMKPNCNALGCIIEALST